jgi:hypothetical protein
MLFGCRRVSHPRLIGRQDIDDAAATNGEGMIFEEDPVRFYRDDPASGKQSVDGGHRIT